MGTLTSIVHEDGWKFIGIFAGISFVLFFLSQPLGWIGLILTGWCVYFFRNPKRVTPQREGLIISPADGIVSLITQVVPPKEFEMGNDPRTRISIFLNVFDVHVNRIPMGGIVEKIIYHPGKFFNASLDKASEFNERQSVIISIDDNQKIAVVQIAGLVARRIRCDIREDESVVAGELYGLIRFGSRVDVYLPVGVNSLVVKGQRMIGGETVLADLLSSETARVGVVR
jgi:phosphatidylserine decarboxylase